ncbi:hypothetical protein LPJ81_000919 [Coemansia sp. IMI 209127]|nr:hypothetical protein LPJ81_000919 [Coemansia sp. IMI 209127]
MALSHDDCSGAGAIIPGNRRLSIIVDEPSYMPVAASDGKDAPADAPQTQSTRPLPPAGGSPDTRNQHTRSPSSSSASNTRNQTMTPPPPQLASNHRANTSGTSPNQYHNSMAQNTTANSSSTPPRIRQTRSEIVHPAHGSHDDVSKYTSGQQHDDPSKNNNYSLWLPWEETTLIDWLFEPANCKLFNEPRRKKECHERIIRDILPNKTSRAIEGKIRTLEKRYQKAAGEIQREDFATIHPVKRPDDVAEALCNNFYKLETIFNTSLGHPRGPQPKPETTPNQHKRKLPWGNNNSLSSNTTGNQSNDTGGDASQIPPASGYAASSQTTVAGSNAGPSSATANNNGNGLSVPGGSPPKITATESLPLPYRMMAYGRKIAPKRDADNTGSNDGAEAGSDVPNMMGSSKRSRTFPATMQKRKSPAFNPTQSKQPSQPLTVEPRHVNNIQQLQQQRYYENGTRYTYEMAGRPSTATLPMMLPLASPMGSSSHGVPPQPASASSAAPLQHHHQHQHYPQPPTPSMPNNGSFRDAYDHGHARSVSNPGATQGSREELEWLQFNLRREELEFRKTVFAQEQELEAKRVRLEEHRLDIKRHELDLEGKRFDMQQRQMDLQLETMKSMSTMLDQVTRQMGNMAGAAAPTQTHTDEASSDTSKQQGGSTTQG